jgi:hypothetical protein
MIRQTGGEVWTDNYLSAGELAAIAPLIARASGSCDGIAERFGVTRLAVLHIKRGLFAAPSSTARSKPATEACRPSRNAPSRKPARAHRVRTGIHLRLVIDNTRVAPPAAAHLNGAA